jgi:phosphopantetheinyl transferase
MRSEKEARCLVATLEMAELDGWPRERYLSAAEANKLATLKTRKRQDEWLAARLAAKYLFLTRLGSGAATPAEARPQLVSLTADRLSEFPCWLYEKVEVLAGPTGRPRLTWCGSTDLRNEISLSHAQTLSCACFSPAGSVGVDVEAALPKAPSFYAFNFTEAERGWVAHRSMELGIGAEWLFTLLWSLKECAVKTSDHLSVWNMPAIEIDILSPIRGLADAHNKQFPGSFHMLDVQIREGSRVHLAQAAVAVLRKFILTIILTGVTN